jgi:hypothetical protein
LRSCSSSRGVGLQCPVVAQEPSRGNPQISEAGRAFLAGLLVQLSDAQLRDLFEVARVTRRSTDPAHDPDGPRATVDEWVKAFKSKRAQIVDHHCPH